MARPLWKGSISFGLVSIPIELHTAVRNHRPRFRMLHAKDKSPVKFQRVCMRDGHPVAWEDWEGEEEFVLEDLGPGECAGGALDMIENGILEADQELYQAKLLVEKHQYSVSVNKSYRAVLAAAKALLVTEGLEPSTDAETFVEFDSRLAQKGIVPAMYRDLRMRVGDLGPKETTGESARDKMDFAKGFVDACRAATEQMGRGGGHEPTLCAGAVAVKALVAVTVH